jgi:2,4-didehydro-3-deoxy-L-rhamnonate hydrolase
MTRFMRVGPVGEEIPVILDDAGASYDLSGITPDIDGVFLADNGIERARDALATGALPHLDTVGLRVGAPIARPGAVLCIGQNYAAHAAESGSAVPEHPIVFFKHPNTMVGAFDDVRIPPGAEQVDWEVELAIVIGSTARYLADTDAATSVIAGYVLSNDVSERHWQRDISGGQWSKGKTAETFNPVGPWLVPADEIDAQSLHIWSTVNGERRQHSTTKDMIFGITELVYQLSQFCVLDPGDLINSGTPEGVAMSGNFPYLAVGDVMRMGIDGLGEQANELV